MNIKFRSIRLVFLFLVMFLPATTLANGSEDYLVLQDIGSYKFITQSRDPLTKKVKQIPGYTVRGAPGILAGVDHFDLDHADTTYETDYESDVADLGVEVQVTQHAGSESDKWLLHEVERGFRFGDYEEDMTPSRFRNIGDNYIFYSKLGGGGYRWISNNIVVDIEYTDLYQQKTEPLEVVQAYLTKFPSTVPAMTIDQAHNEKWIKDEIDRRLWLGGKWMARIEASGDLNELSSVVKSLNVFLDYREKYYGIDAAAEKKTLWEYQQAKNKAGIKTKLEEYKTWWEGNKDNPITL